jgi:steroid 5-alpha reductase family enzyme
VLYEAQRRGELATTGPYARVRHPQYAGFVLIMLGFLFQWPTLLTLAMFPVLVWMYVRLARAEERETAAGFGAAYARYAMRVPAFIPRLSRDSTPTTTGRPTPRSDRHGNSPPSDTTPERSGPQSTNWRNEP